MDKHAGDLTDAELVQMMRDNCRCHRCRTTDMCPDAESMLDLAKGMRDASRDPSLANATADEILDSIPGARRVIVRDND